MSDSMDHPFTEFLRILGKGPHSRRPLTEDEALRALQMMLANQVTDKQLGAFLLLMRANGETPSELVGFVKGLRLTLNAPDLEPCIDLDWAAYAGKWRYPPYFLLSIKLLVQNGYTVLLHGDAGQFSNRTYAHSVLEPLGFYQACSLSDAQHAIAQGRATYLGLEHFAPAVRGILHLKSELGVRTVFNTAVKCLNPLNARVAVQGIYHKGVENLHHAVALALQTPCNLVFKGEGGEAEIRPDALSQLYFSHKEHATQETVALKGQIERQERPKTWENDHLLELWHARLNDVYGQACVIATMAVALMALEKWPVDVAFAHADQAWQNRLAHP